MRWIRLTGLVLILGLASAARAQREVVVFAASSLRESFAELGQRFERAHPGVKVVFNLSGSQELRTQIENGAQADVFASADLKHMRALQEANLVSAPHVFARNQPVLVVPKGNPAGLRGLHDLPEAHRIVLGVPDVPIGAYSLRVLDAASREYGADFRAKVEARVVSREMNVRQVLAKVGLGEADAAIVYRTDFAAAGQKVEMIAIPPRVNVEAEYPIATVEKSKEAALAREFVELVLSPAGQEILSRFGFGNGSGS
jgi:molybdate transport system substrate-binding protein